MKINYFLMVVLVNLFVLQPVSASSFNHNSWDSLLKKHVTTINNGRATVVDYQGFSNHQKQLKQYLITLSNVQQNTFDQWSRNEQLAFLVNAYNAATVELILTAWPSIDSIKDLGSLFSSPWSKEFVVLLGEQRSLDDIEHNLIRGSGRYNDPRVHFAVNCASIGCPALRPEAYSSEKLDQQLDEQTRLFLSDRSRNRLNGNTLKLSSIFKWYRKDFEKGWQGYRSLTLFLVDHAEALNLSTAKVKELQTGAIEITYLDYNWQLNEKEDLTNQKNK